MPTLSTPRAAAVFVSLGLIFSTLAARVAYLQTAGRQQTLGKAERQQHQRSVLQSRRGGIFDRDGLALALTIQKQDLCVDPGFVIDTSREDEKMAARLREAMPKLAYLLDTTVADLNEQITANAGKHFLRLGKDIDESRSREIEKLNLGRCGFYFAPYNSRTYPMGSLAAHILGGAGADGSGLDGVELRFNDLLAGKDGWERKLKDSQRRAIDVAAEDYLSPQHGQHLILTIDANLQLIAEQELAATCKKFQAKRGEVVVMDPRTGEVLALANYPTFDPNDLESANNELRRDRCLTDPYEPGSTIKPFIVGPALQWHQTRVTEMWSIPAIHYRTPYGRLITDVHHYGNLSTWDVLVKSSNIGMSMLGERMGNPRLYHALTSWGYGRTTGIELPGENPGKLNPLRIWSKYSTESASQGYELMITPLQLCRAFCAYANGGRLVTPTLIRGVLDADGQLVSRTRPTDLQLLPQAVDAGTAAQIRQVLCDVVIRGTAAGAGRSDIWNIFGKTGTAHISLGRGGYSPTRFNSSFICAAPAEDPKLVVAFVIHDPTADGHYGGTVAAPGAKRFIERALTYLQVPPSPELQPPPADVAKTLFDFKESVYRRKIEKTKVALAQGM